MSIGDVLNNLGEKFGHMKSLELAIDAIAEKISNDHKIPIWQVHNIYNNVKDKINAIPGCITITVLVSNSNEIDIRCEEENKK